MKSGSNTLDSTIDAERTETGHVAAGTAGRPMSAVQTTALGILVTLSMCHLLNDLVQSLIPAIYPILKVTFRLSFQQIGLITLTYQATASLLQPFVGYITDRRPRPYSLVIGMGLTLSGLLLVACAPTFAALLPAVALVGAGSSVFHPESSRMARLASGGRHGFAQSLFQVGGNAGASIGPLLAAFIIAPNGQHALAWFASAALAAILPLSRVSIWYRERLAAKTPAPSVEPGHSGSRLPKTRVALAIAVLLALIFSKYFYLASITSYYMFFLIDRFHVTVQNAQLHLFIFLGAVALGTFIGGPIGDRIGRKYVIWASILGVLPFTLLMPAASLFWTGILSAVIGFVLASAFSAILVYAQELVPGRVGVISGLFFGFAFGMGGVGAAVLGVLADRIGIREVYHICAFLPAIGLLAAFLPNVGAAADRSRR
jgi:FSR family fosmidomycin resistance protein-like MFS transporter